MWRWKHKSAAGGKGGRDACWGTGNSRALRPPRGHCGMDAAIKLEKSGGRLCRPRAAYQRLPMIHVCSLARLTDMIARTGARYVVSLLAKEDSLTRPASIA